MTLVPWPHLPVMCIIGSMERTDRKAPTVSHSAYSLAAIAPGMFAAYAVLWLAARHLGWWVYAALMTCGTLSQIIAKAFCTDWRARP